MFTFSFFYAFMYLFIFLNLLVLAFTQFPLQLITKYSTSHFFIFLLKYTHTKNLFLFLIFCLTGLPPVGLFFIKFNILAFLLYQNHIFISIVLFFMFFFNMLYYTQLFNFKNIKKNTYTTVTPVILSDWISQNTWLLRGSTYKTYQLTLLVVNTSLALVLSLVLFTDYFLIFSLIF